ncbi:unnamed protein product [Onchocerca ochengi]|uniref:NTR domain-containing protein n=1 Tax=Onchocerca ochengi TaxID=42157 RepID=A0A182EVL0_ONCOC|nr:unnamed protein product [Onchocerca ochengi]
MMCKEVKLINPKEPGNTIKALIKGGDCNYVTESIVNKLKLRQASSKLRMLMVGTRKCESRKVNFGVQTLNGNVKNIQAYIVDSILKRIHIWRNNYGNRSRSSLCGTRQMRQDNAEVENNESHKTKAIASIAKKESQLQMDQIEQM